MAGSYARLALPLLTMMSTLDPARSRARGSEVDRHTLRRTLATLLRNGFNGRDPVRAEVVQALCGHDDIRTTLAYYAEVEQATMVEEIRRAVG